MIQIFKKTLTFSIITFALLVSMIVVTAPAHGQEIKKSLNCGGDKISLNSGCSDPKAAEGSSKVETLLKNIINVFSAIVGAVSVIMIIVGGFRYVTSGGDANNISGAKNTVLYAVVGLIIVAFAQVIVQFVLQKV